MAAGNRGSTTVSECRRTKKAPKGAAMGTAPFGYNTRGAWTALAEKQQSLQSTRQRGSKNETRLPWHGTRTPCLPRSITAGIGSTYPRCCAADIHLAIAYEGLALRTDLSEQHTCDAAASLCTVLRNCHIASLRAVPDSNARDKLGRAAVPRHLVMHGPLFYSTAARTISLRAKAT